MRNTFTVTVGKVITCTGTFIVKANNQAEAEIKASEKLESARIEWDKSTECDSKAEILNVEIEAAQSQPQGRHTSGGA